MIYAVRVLLSLCENTQSIYCCTFAATKLKVVWKMRISDAGKFRGVSLARTYSISCGIPTNSGHRSGRPARAYHNHWQGIYHICPGTFVHLSFLLFSLTMNSTCRIFRAAYSQTAEKFVAVQPNSAGMVLPLDICRGLKLCEIFYQLYVTHNHIGLLHEP